MNVPAICNNCSTIFNSGIVVQNSRNVSFAGNTSGPCPNCGGIGHIPDGLFNFVDDTIEILKAPQISINELLRFANSLKNGLDNEMNHNEIVNNIISDNQEFRRIVDVLPHNKNELYAFIGLILVAIQILISLSSIHNEPGVTNYNITNNYTEEVINNIYNDYNYKIKTIEKLDFEYKKLNKE